jgi:hypothetical protein
LLRNLPAYSGCRACYYYDCVAKIIRRVGLKGHDILLVNV